MNSRLFYILKIIAGGSIVLISILISVLWILPNDNLIIPFKIIEISLCIFLGLFGILLCLIKDNNIKLEEDRFDTWNIKNLKHYDNILEKTISEANLRESILQSRAGALLSLNGIILALICTFLVYCQCFEEDTYAYISVAVISFIISSLFLGLVLIPPYRIVLNIPNINDYWCKKYGGFTEKEILIEFIKIRTSASLRLNDILSTSSSELSFAMAASMIGLWGVGATMLKIYVFNDYTNFVIYLLLLFVLIFILIYAWKTHIFKLWAKYKQKLNKE